MTAKKQVVVQKPVDEILKDTMDKEFAKQLPRFVKDIMQDGDLFWEVIYPHLEGELTKALKRVRVEDILSAKIEKALNNIKDSDIKQIVMKSVLRI